MVRSKLHIESRRDNLLIFLLLEVIDEDVMDRCTKNKQLVQ
ncbi:hypothetical protein SP19_159 [Salmonella phage 19]|nr:hypothetical protein SP19_159 [Salmonella phage 19]